MLIDGKSAVRGLQEKRNRVDGEADIGSSVPWL
jgi:hypothetical protein